MLVIGAGAGVSAVSDGNEIVWMSASDPLVRSRATYPSPRRATGWLAGVVASPKSARGSAPSRRPIRAVPALIIPPVLTSEVTHDRPKLVGLSLMSTWGTSSTWPLGGTGKAKLNPVEPAIVLSAENAWNFTTQQPGRTPQTAVRVARWAKAGPAGAPVPVASVVITPVWRSRISIVRADR